MESVYHFFLKIISLYARFFIHHIWSPSCANRYGLKIPYIERSFGIIVFKRYDTFKLQDNTL